ncbi:thioredoxin family protein [Flaviaesturariibacter terrae]
MKKQSLLFLLLLIISFSALAGTGIRFVENKKWKEILALAKSQHKPIFLDAYASWCGPCKRMKESVFPQSMVGDLYNAKFINVKMDMEEGEGIALARELNIEAYPTFFFLNEKGELLHKSVGALNAVAFLELGRTALDPGRQFYTRKREAEAGKLTPAQAHAWLAEAEQTDAGAIDSTVARYLRRVSYPLLDSDMLHIVLDYGRNPTRAQIDFLFANSAEVARILGYTAPELERNLLRRLRNYALNLSAASDSVDFHAFETVVQGYAPGAVRTETEKLRANWYFTSEQDDEGMAALLTLLQLRNSRLFAEDIADLFLEHAKRIAPHSRAGEVLAALKAFVPRSDEPKLFYRDVALLVIFLKQKDSDGIRTYAQALYDNPAVPEGLREQVKDLRDYQ